MTMITTRRIPSSLLSFSSCIVSGLLYVVTTYTHIRLLEVCDRAQPPEIPEIVLKVVLHVWLTVPYRPNMFDTAFEYHARLVSSSHPMKFADAEYIQDAIIDGLSADAFILRIVDDLRRPEISDRYVAALFESLRIMGMTVLLRPYFIKHKCIDAVAEAVETKG